MTNLLLAIGQKIAIGLTVLSVSVAGLFGYAPQRDLGASIPITPAVFSTSLASSITASATSMTLVSGTDKAGNSLSGYICFTLDEGTSVEEFACGTTSSTAVTSMLRGIDPIDGDLEVTALKKAHRRGASVKVTTYPVVGILARILNGTETVPNVLSYSSASSSFITSSANLASKAYVDGVAVAGAPDASTSTKGIVEIATTAEVIAGTSAGGTSALLVAPNSLFSPTSTATTIVPVTNTSGKLSQGFLDLTSSWTFTGAVSVSTATSTASSSSDALNIMPAGVMQMYAATSTVPSGWLLADGTSYATSTYPRLFSVIGYTYGGSTSTFAVPNMKSRMPYGLDSSMTANDIIGETGGATSTAIGFSFASGASQAINLSGGGGNGYGYGSSNPTLTTGTSTFSTISPYMTLNFIIKY